MQEYIQTQTSNDRGSRPTLPSAEPAFPPSAADSPAVPTPAVPGMSDGSLPSASTGPSRSNLSLPLPPHAVAESPAHETSHLMSPQSTAPHSATRSKTSGSVSEHSSDAGAASVLAQAYHTQACYSANAHGSGVVDGCMKLLHCQSLGEFCIDVRAHVTLNRGMHSKVFPSCRSARPNVYLLDAQDVSSRRGCSERGQISSLVYSWPA